MLPTGNPETVPKKKIDLGAMATVVVTLQRTSASDAGIVPMWPGSISRWILPTGNAS